MTYLPARCDTLMIPSGAAGDHLFFITTDACAAGKHLLVNVTSIKLDRHVDDTCIIKAGEHRFVTHDSYILYRGAIIDDGVRLGRMVDGWVYRKGDAASDELTTRILAGFADSPFTPRHVTAYLRGLSTATGGDKVA